jgi:phage FluMu protein Com
MIKYKGEVYRELRCPNCRALLLEEYVFSGRLRIKCGRCKEITTIKFKSPKQVVLEAQS